MSPGGIQPSLFLVPQDNLFAFATKSGLFFVNRVIGQMPLDGKQVADIGRLVLLGRETGEAFLAQKDPEAAAPGVFCDRRIQGGRNRSKGLALAAGRCDSRLLIISQTDRCRHDSDLSVIFE